MSFQKQTIANTISAIHERKYVLPAIQREFVWKPQQILKLLDSIMRGYPISTFLFWEMREEQMSNFEFYEFLMEYHELENIHNRTVDMRGVQGAYAILDGQQRLTSLYIALKGTYAARAPYQRYYNPKAYPKKKVYLNLLDEPPEDSECEYDFAFLTETEAAERDEKHYWFPIGDILDIKEMSGVSKYLRENKLFDSDYASNTLSRLFEVIHKNESISHYLETSAELDKVLNIFIRINSGGTTLGYSDLLLSIATARWKEENAREAINIFCDEINGSLGKDFNFSKDVILKACLVLCDFNIKFSVDNFNKTNMLEIEKQWDQITGAIRSAVRLVASFGFSRENLTSHYTIIPIAYYLKKIGIPDNFETSTAKNRQESRKRIKRWLVSSLLKNVFGRTADGTLNPIRECIKTITDDSFPMEHIVERFKGTPRSLQFSEDDLKRLLALKYGQGETLLALSLLFPFFDLGRITHVDHAFPAKGFTRSTLRAKGVPDDKIDDFIAKYNYIGNLQLLDGIPNMEKSAKDFDQWLSEMSADELEVYKTRYLIPTVDLSWPHFDKFLEEREKLMIERLKKELILV